MIRADGQIHVSHKNKEPFCEWNLECLASRCFLVLVQCVPFEKSKYPGYQNKRGDGSRCDEPFKLGECSTFKFRLCRVAKELYAEKMHGREVKEQESKRLLQTKFQGISQRPVLFDLSYRRDVNLRQVLDPLVQSRKITSPLDLSYYQEHRFSQFEDVSIRSTQRQVSFALERSPYQGNFIQHDKLMSTERSSFHFQASHHHQVQLLECPLGINRVTHEIYGRERNWTSFPHPYTGELLERRRLVCQELQVQARQETFIEYSKVRTSFRHPYYE